MAHIDAERLRQQSILFIQEGFNREVDDGAATMDWIVRARAGHNYYVYMTTCQWHDFVLTLLIRLATWTSLQRQNALRVLMGLSPSRCGCRGSPSRKLSETG